MTCAYHEGHRSRNRVQQRHDYMVELRRRMPPLLVKEIALGVFMRFGNPTGKPLDHSSVLHHLRGKCRCER